MHSGEKSSGITVQNVAVSEGGPYLDLNHIENTGGNQCKSPSMTVIASSTTRKPSDFADHTSFFTS